MLANYGYSDGSGNYFITIDTDKCNACGLCVEICPSGIFELLNEDPYDPVSEGRLVVVRTDKTGKLRYECGQCKPCGKSGHLLPCVATCKPGAIAHSW
ncbi:MAG: 4Fe-4S binding protein [Desulfomonilaceae bacterium]